MYTRTVLGLAPRPASAVLVEEREQPLELVGLRARELLGHVVHVEDAGLAGGADGEADAAGAAAARHADVEAQPAEGARLGAETRRARAAAGRERHGVGGGVRGLEQIVDVNLGVGVERPEHRRPRRRPAQLHEGSAADARPREERRALVDGVERERAVGARRREVDGAAGQKARDVTSLAPPPPAAPPKTAGDGAFPAYRLFWSTAPSSVPMRKRVASSGRHASESARTGSIAPPPPLPPLPFLRAAAAPPPTTGTVTDFRRRRRPPTACPKSAAASLGCVSITSQMTHEPSTSSDAMERSSESAGEGSAASVVIGVACAEPTSESEQYVGARTACRPVGSSTCACDDDGSRRSQSWR